MKKYLFLFLFFLVALSACTSYDFEAFTTDLRILVIDSSSSVENIKVELYRNQADFELRLSPIASADADSKGTVLFKNLEPANYYVYAYATKGNLYYDNSHTVFNIDQVLVEGSLTNIVIPVRYQRPTQPTRMVLQQIWLMNYPTDLNSVKYLQVEPTIYRVVGDEFVETNSLPIRFCNYDPQIPISSLLNENGGLDIPKDSNRDCKQRIQSVPKNVTELPFNNKESFLVAFEPTQYDLGISAKDTLTKSYFPSYFFIGKSELNPQNVVLQVDNYTEEVQNYPQRIRIKYETDFIIDLKIDWK